VTLCFLGDPLPGMPGSQVGPVPIIGMYGVTPSGNSVTVCVHGFAPYFYVPAIQGFRNVDCVAFRVSMKPFALCVV
jgi:DNA polymerase delta subunit 1